MNPNKLVNWAWSKVCNGMRNGDTCGHPACIEIQQAVEFLRRLERFEGINKDGEPVTGYIIKD